MADATYVYRPELAAHLWPTIGAFVTRCVEAASTESRYSKAELFAAATPLTVWTWSTAGLPLDPTAVFDRDVIDRFTSVVPQYRTKGSRNTMRSRLLRISEALLTPDAIVTALRPLGPSDPTAPYSDEEITGLRSWASAQPTAAKRLSAGGLLALGIGAGLSGREIIECRLTDVHADEQGVVVSVRGERSRRVPVVCDWEDALVRLISESDCDRPVFREGQTGDNRNLITDFVSRSRGKVGLQARRMRTTWIVHHLNSGTPTIALLDAAGVQTLEAFDRFVRFAEPGKWRDVRAKMRGSASLPAWGAISHEGN